MEAGFEGLMHSLALFSQRGELERNGYRQRLSVGFFWPNNRIKRKRLIGINF